MSDTENLESIPNNLRRAFKEEKDDVISLATIIDMYSNKIDGEGTYDEKVNFLSHLLELLQTNPSVTKDIGWDLPKVIIGFLNMDNIDPLGSLSSNKIMSYVMKIFNEIALKGNPKECLFVACEMMSNLKIGDKLLKNDNEEYTMNFDKETLITIENIMHRNPREFFLDIRSHILIELINATLKRITTLYPSRFLEEAINAMDKFIKINCSDTDDAIFLLKRFYTFCRNYIPPQKPHNKDNLGTVNQLEIIEENENAIQRNLLRHILTFSLGHLMKNKRLPWRNSFFADLDGKYMFTNDYYVEIKKTLSRFYQLAISFDIDLRKEFIDVCINESKHIYSAFSQVSGLNNETNLKKPSHLIYQLSYTHELQKLSTLTKVLIDHYGILILSTLSFEESSSSIYPEITIEDAIYMYLRFVTPSLLNNYHMSVIDAANFWIWTAIIKNKSSDSKKILKSMPRDILMVYLQIILSQGCQEVNEKLRTLYFTLVTRSLCLIPEDISFAFVIDTLLHCPFEHGKSCVLAILKDLMLRQDQDDMNKLVTSLEKLDIDNKRNPITPKLPPRPYILVNDHRIASIHSLAIMCIEANKNKNDPLKLRTLLTYLNFLICLISKWDHQLLKKICDQVDLVFNEDSSNELPEVEFVKIANATLKNHLNG